MPGAVIMKNYGRRVSVLSVHPLVDTRIRNQLITLIDHRYVVTYINWSNIGCLDSADRGSTVKLIRKEKSPIIGLNFLTYLEMLLWFVVRTVQSKPDIVHIHDIILLPIILPVKIFRKCKFVFDVHERFLKDKTSRRYYYRFLLEFFSPFLDGYVAVSESTSLKVKKPNEIIANYQRRADYSLENSPRKHINVIYFGSLSQSDRDIDLLLHLANALLSEFKYVRFELGGILHGNDVSNYVEKINGLCKRYPHGFIWHGVMSRADVIKKTCTADIGLLFLKPFVENFVGGSPHKIFEYLTAGAAIFATEGFARSSEITQSGAGMLFAAGTSPDVVERRMFEVIKDPEKLYRMKEASKRLGYQYSWESVEDRYLRLYSHITS